MKKTSTINKCNLCDNDTTYYQYKDPKNNKTICAGCMTSYSYDTKHKNWDYDEKGTRW